MTLFALTLICAGCLTLGAAIGAGVSILLVRQDVKRMAGYTMAEITAIGAEVGRTVDYAKVEVSSLIAELERARMRMEIAHHSFIKDNYRDYLKRLEAMRDAVAEAYAQGREDRGAE